MDGLRITVRGLTLPADAPVLPSIDTIESAGSLFLLEPAHPAGSWAAGVPANGATLPNLFGANLAALGGVGAVDPTISIGGTINNGTKGKVERSGKGGLHVIVSQANALASGDGVKVPMAAALADYLVKHASNDYYVSVWDRLTRINAGSLSSTDDPMYQVASSASSTGIGIASATQWLRPPGTVLLGSRVLGNVPGPRMASHALDSAVGSFSTSYSAGPVYGAPAGTYAAAILASRNTYWPSAIFYRMYIEDLTVSGRSYAQVDAIDYALYTREVLTPGGRYYGDTFTNPTTIP